MQINNMKDTKELSKDIQIEMLKNNLNKQDMQKRLFVSYPTMLKKIEQPHSMTLTEFTKMCVVLKISVNELLIKKK